MLRHILIYFFLSQSTAHAQNMLPVKYKDAIFPEVTITKNNSYATGEHPGTKDKHYLFNFYEPKSDATLKRPLIIWLHGGGFKFGTKNAKGIKLWSETFAQRGYVCVALNYRMSKKNPLFNFIELKKSCYGAVQSVKEAVAFFKKNHEL
ncbi:MAG: Acetyl esterase/lipase [Sediminibacterium sp.]|nr:Acetyl esterase/lipase [Sediminibacterium sp.]